MYATSDGSAGIKSWWWWWSSFSSSFSGSCISRSSEDIKDTTDSWEGDIVALAAVACVADATRGGGDVGAVDGTRDGGDVGAVVVVVVVFGVVS